MLSESVNFADGATVVGGKGGDKERDRGKKVRVCIRRADLLVGERIAVRNELRKEGEKYFWVELDASD